MEKIDITMMAPIGERIKEYRQLKHLTQNEMANLLHISPKHYGEIERGKTGMSVPVLIKIAEILDRTTDDIIKGTKVEKNPTRYIEMTITVPMRCYRLFKGLSVTQKEKTIKAFQSFVEATTY